MGNLLHLLLRIALLAGLLLGAGCTPNAAYRSQTDNTSACPAQGCTDRVLEQHAEYDLGFVEFTDHGNVFNREHLNAVLEHVKQHADSPQGAVVAVFVHGWKHNASAEDENLRSFRHLLQQASKVGITQKRRLIGIYIGWRGQSLDVPLAEHLTYWVRKNTANSVGNGGVTEFLVRLEQQVAKGNKTDPNHNLLLAIGHSFGGAVLISALNDVLLERVITAQEVGRQHCSDSNRGTCATCVQTRPFGHGVILLNPAIEANELLQLKEVVAEQGCYARNQQKLLHVVSSQADTATNIAFRVGQYLGVSVGSSELPLQRTYKGKPVTLFERELNTTTIGNYLPFRTGISVKRNGQNQDVCAAKGEEREECYISCKDGDSACFKNAALRGKHIPTGSSEPLHFLYTDENFIKDHSDIFNFRVGGYIASVALESSVKRLLATGRGDTAALKKLVGQACVNQEQEFDFAHCFDYYSDLFEKTP